MTFFCSSELSEEETEEVHEGEWLSLAEAGEPGGVPGDLPRGGLLQAQEDEEEEGGDDLRGRDTVSGTAGTHTSRLAFFV